MKGVLRSIKKGGVFILGMLVVMLGIILIPAPGPGLLVIIGGLLILSTEFEWAKRYLHHARQKLEQAKDKLKARSSSVKSAKDVDGARHHKGQRKGRN